jgi:hypothetical protein
MIVMLCADFFPPLSSMRIMIMSLILTRVTSIYILIISVNHDNHDNQRSIRYWQNLSSVFMPHDLVAGKQKCARLIMA